MTALDTIRARLAAMPVRPGALVGLLALVLVGGWVVRGAYRGMYAEPADRLRADIAKLEGELGRSQRSVDDASRLAQKLRSVTDRTLGGSVESVDAELRRSLNRIVEAVGLVDATVDTETASRRPSPARRGLPKKGSWKKLRDELDFIELAAWIAGEGTFAQAVELVDRVDAAPWINRITQVRLDPKDNGGRFAIRVRLVTLFVPGEAPETVADQPYDAQRLAPLQMLVAANPFRIPPPAPKPVVAAAPRPSPPAPKFPWAQWSLTGIADGPAGSEAWLTNRSSGESRRLGVGHSIGPAAAGAEMLAASGDWAIFRLGDRRFRVLVGTNLNDRTPVNE
ncbi:MAG: hypothetical protein GY715_12435 [Planctomycetes bacterium]|nr:hypothetical protein [Planctomycetota bacterium]